MDAKARTGRRIDTEKSLNGALGAYGRDGLNGNGSLMLRFVETNKLAITNTFLRKRKSGVLHTFDVVRGSSRNNLKRTDSKLRGKYSGVGCKMPLYTRNLHSRRRRIRIVKFYDQNQRPACTQLAGTDHHE